MRRAAPPLPPLFPVLPVLPALLAMVGAVAAALLAALLTAPAAQAAGRAEQRTPVVLVHGYGDTAASLDGLEDHLHPQGWLYSGLAEFGYDWAEMTAGSSFLNSLNSGDETPGATRYTTFSSACDQQIPPGDGRAPAPRST